MNQSDILKRDIPTVKKCFKGILRHRGKEYECRKIKTLHELLISAEEYGGEADDSISLLLNDVELWKRRGYLLQGEKKKHIQTMWYPLLWLQPYVPELYIC